MNEKVNVFGIFRSNFVKTTRMVVFPLLYYQNGSMSSTGKKVMKIIFLQILVMQKVGRTDMILILMTKQAAVHR